MAAPQLTDAAVERLARLAVVPVRDRLQTIIDAEVDVDRRGCWRWHGTVDADGRPRVNLLGRNQLVSRLLYELEHGPLGHGTRLRRCQLGGLQCVHPGDGHVTAVPYADIVRDGWATRHAKAA